MSKRKEVGGVTLKGSRKTDGLISDSSRLDYAGDESERRILK